MRKNSVQKSVSTAVNRMKVKKLTPADLMKITGGCADTRDCKGPGQPTCIAYIVKDPAP